MRGDVSMAPQAPAPCWDHISHVVGRPPLGMASDLNELTRGVCPCYPVSPGSPVLCQDSPAHTHTHIHTQCQPHNNPVSRGCRHLHFIGDNTEALRGEGLVQGHPQSKLYPGLSDSKTQTTSHHLLAGAHSRGPPLPTSPLRTCSARLPSSIQVPPSLKPASSRKSSLMTHSPTLSASNQLARRLFKFPAQV